MGKSGIDLRGRIAEALGNVGPDAPLRQIVESPQVQMALAKFEAADRAAGAAQRRFRSWGRRGIAATTFGVLVGALLLFPIDELVAGMPRIAIGALQTLALLTSVMATLVLSWRRPLEEWRSDRGKAERLRAHVLERILGAAPPAGADVAQLVAGKRKVLEHAYIADQLEYLLARSEQHRRLAGKVTPLRLLSYAIIAAASLLGVVTLLRGFGVVGPALHPAIAWLSVEDASRWQLGATTIASGLLAYATARTLLDEDERKATLYKATAARLQQIAGASGPGGGLGSDAEAALMRQFEAARAILQQEHAVWSFLRLSETEEDEA
jgi:uncharacterized membrane protein YidH (DUF202 family)